MDIDGAKRFLRAISTLPQHERSVRMHIYIRHPGLSCNNYNCKLPENLDRKLALKKVLKS